MKKKNFFSLLIIIVGFLAFLLWIASKVIVIGKDLRAVSEYLEYVYYLGAFIAVFFLLIRPFLIVMFSPSFSLHLAGKKLDGKQKRKVIVDNYLELRKHSKVLIRKKLLNDEQDKLLKEELARKEGTLIEKYTSLRELLVKITNKTIKKDVRKIIIDTAKDTLYLSAISQNSFMDMLIVVVNNFRMLKRIVKRCGFRPSFFRLLKFYINVSFSALIADGAQKIDINSFLGTSLKGLSKPVVGSLLDGLVNAFFMLRTGFLAKNYIFGEYKDEKEKINLMNSAFVEAAGALPELTIASVVKPISDIIDGTIIRPTRYVVKKLFGKEQKLEMIEETE